jgi:serine/threonine protein phosphatase PrpC
MRTLNRTRNPGGASLRPRSRIVIPLLFGTLILVGLLIGGVATAALGHNWPTARWAVVPVTTGAPVSAAAPAFVIWEVSPSNLKAAHVGGPCESPPLPPPATEQTTVAWVRTGTSLAPSCLRQLRTEVRLLAIGARVKAVTLVRQVVNPLGNPAHPITRSVHYVVGPEVLLRDRIVQLRASSITSLVEQLRSRTDAQGEPFDPSWAVVVSSKYRSSGSRPHLLAPAGIAIMAVLIIALGAAVISARWPIAAATSIILTLAVIVMSAIVGDRQQAPAVALCGAVGLCSVALILVGVQVARRRRAAVATPAHTPTRPPVLPSTTQWRQSPQSVTNGDSLLPVPANNFARQRPGGPDSRSISATGLSTRSTRPSSGSNAPSRNGRPVLTLSVLDTLAPVPTRQLLAGWPSADVVGEPPSGVRIASAPSRVVTVSDSACDGLSAAGVEIRAATVRGLSHRWNGRPRQDAFSFGVDAASRHVVLAVADGVGSAPNAEIGAHLATYHGVEQLTEALDRGATLADLSGTALMDRVAALIRTGSPFPADDRLDRLVATTLVVAVVETASCGGQHRVWTAQVGNSEAIVLRNRRYRYLGAVAESDILDNRTASLPMSPDAVEERCSVVPDGSVLFLCSDGITDPLGHGRGSAGVYLAEHLAIPPDPLELARTIGFLRKGFLDDRVLAGVWL